MNCSCQSHSFSSQCRAFLCSVSWTAMTPTGLKWYWVRALLRQRACTSRQLCISSTKNGTRGRNDSKGLPHFPEQKCDFTFTPKLSGHFFPCCCFEYLPSLTPILRQIFSSSLTSFQTSLSLEALAPLAGPLPLGVLAELSLWFTHSVPSGLTGWHKDMEQSWERRAGSIEPQTHKAV